jgi:hypothetical protein
MRKLASAVAAVLALGLAAPGLAQDGKAMIEAVMTEYLKLWNNHDAAAITSHVYRLPETHPWRTREGLEKEFARLRSEGYSHSTNDGIKGCITGPDTGQVELRFTRLKTDGGFMPPEKRLSIYRLQKFPDGWKVVGMSAGDVKTGMPCPAVQPK